MKQVYSYVINMVSKSKKILEQDVISPDEFHEFKKDCESVYTLILKECQSPTIKELALKGLRFKVKKIRNPFLRWIYYQLTAARNEITYQAPYLKGSSESDYFKQYIFWTKMKMEGIIYNLQRL